MEKNVQSLQIEFAEWKSKQDYLVKHVDELRSDMTDIKRAVFQAKMDVDWCFSSYSCN